VEQIKAKIAELSESFFALPLVKEYFAQVDLINADTPLLNLSDEVKKLQRLMTLHIKNKDLHQKYKEEYEKKLNEYNSHPYVVNYNYLKNEVENLLLQMKQIIEK
jgi:cell fate (sporulation/competence/biofilm development) regulator YmcA (YheA/YmcA/DUF963 family)